MEIKKIQDSDDPDIAGMVKLLVDWGEYNDFGEEGLTEIVKSRCTKKDFPVVLVAKINGQVVGTVSLVSNDTELRQDLFPMLTMFVVDSNCRGQGIGKQLLERILAICQTEFKEVFLTTKLEGFYEKFGFEYLGTTKAYINFETEKPYEERIYRKKF